MGYLPGSEQKSISKEVREGTKVIVITVVEEEENMWELKIHGKGEHATTWTEFFSTAEGALTEADSAISEEGFDEFYSIKEFAYLE